MEQGFDFLRAADQKLLDVACQQIIATLHPERIIGLSVRTTRTHSWSVLKSNWKIEALLIVDLMIVVRSTDARELHEIEDMISHFNRESLQVNPMVHKASFVKRKVEEGDEFFCRVHHRGPLLYKDSEAIEFHALPWNTVNLGEQFLRLKLLHDNWSGRAVQALAESIRIIGDGHPMLGLTLLLQAAEYACINILRVGNGYNPPTRNLRKLLKLAGAVSERTQIVFPGNTEVEQALLHELLRAHTYARYKDDYVVPEDVADILVERVKNLLAIANDVFTERANELVDLLPLDDTTED